MSPVRSFLALITFFAAVTLAGFVGNLFGPGDWYAALIKPSWTPPNWLFAPVWITLYVMMAIAAWLIWRNQNRGSRRALAWWVLQLVLNAAWSVLFFGLHKIGLALADLTALLIVLWITIGRFRRITPTAASLMLPYILWSAYAWALNFSIWWLNIGNRISLY